MRELEKQKPDWLEPMDLTGIPTKTSDVARQNPLWLENRNSNVITQLFCVVMAFSDFRFVAQVGGEIVRERVNYVTSTRFLKPKL